MIDFSSARSVLTTVLGLILFSLVAVGVRMVFMQVVQRRRERENRQINERLKALIAAYKTLGGAFTGNLAVDPVHLRDLRQRGRDTADNAVGGQDSPAVASDLTQAASLGSERGRRVRDAVEAALSDIILLGTDEQVRLAAQAATDMTAGKHIETAALVVSLRAFIREVLELGPIPSGLPIPNQGPLRGSGQSGRGQGSKTAGAGRGGGGGGGAGGVGGGGSGMGLAGSRMGGSHPEPGPE